jgi:hypothetical protein
VFKKIVNYGFLANTEHAPKILLSMLSRHRCFFPHARHVSMFFLAHAKCAYILLLY